ncbi:MAG: orotidine-5'-phosphate decarboxylase [Alphaproteobacteria bacterium]|nr:orotidine-5'-phosphate decarboxylase [Alphaproteobacteria bacterium]NDG04791.1 orotidine-5'-phosphate decarboxylase [Alphaproteobacteria bacterium]
MAMHPKIFTAIDTGDVHEAEERAKQLSGVTGIKLGLEFFVAHGPAGYRQVARHARHVFLDLKLHDIPNTVAGAVQSVLPLAPQYLTVHASGGPAMMRAAVQAAGQGGHDGAKAPKILAVTVLTSLDADDLLAVGQPPDATAQVLRLARLAQDCGLAGLVCAPTEIEVVRQQVGPDFVLMVPGIRPAGPPVSGSGGRDDQKRTTTPRQAMIAGATHVVIGRPITQSPDPAATATTISQELESLS